MEFNKFIFPSPSSSYDFTHPNLIMMPKLNFLENNGTQIRTELNKKLKNKSDDKIPCFLFDYIDEKENLESNTILLYFHGNAEDLGLAYDLLNNLKNELKIHIIAVEYPGYGVYPGEANADKISIDAKCVYDYLIQELKFPEKNIIIFGRSIGSGPATYLSARRNPFSLILMSAYLSIKLAAGDLVGKFLSFFLADRFKNIEEIQKVKVPTFFLHGKKDDLIPFYHSKELYNKCQNGDYWFPNNMTHNSFSIVSDLLVPIENFLEKHKYQIKLVEKDKFNWADRLKKKCFVDAYFLEAERNKKKKGTKG